MGIMQEITTSDYVSSAMQWWRDVGVDVMVDEEPRRWLAASVASPGRRIVPVAPQVQKPNSLSSLVDWLMTSDDLPEIGPTKRRVAPAGDPTCGLMVLTDVPEAADIESGMLFSGQHAALFDNMLTALGRDRQSIYLASLSSGRPPSGRLSSAALESLSTAAREHVRFAAPKRLWILGSAASCAILGMTDVEAHGRLHTINLDDVIVDVVATAHPRLLDSKDKKLRAWVNMQRLIEKDDK
jgi:uracil-DNA glycosylase family 4